MEDLKMSEEEELKAFEEYLKNMSVEDFNRITKEVDKEIFTQEYYDELNKGVDIKC